MLRSRLTYSLMLLLFSFCLSAQEKEKQDSLVRLLGCDELQQVEMGGMNYRKALGNARFEHNSTLLLCDTALWNVNANLINAHGHVRIIQNETVLESDRLDYLIDRNLAQFRGAVVQLQDKQRNTLRTRNLDYNTKDSVATFIHGGAFRDKDGQVIESDEGSYDSKIKVFSFSSNVNMYTDSVFVKTEDLDFNTQTNIAVFGRETDVWRNDNMLSAQAGWYDRKEELFLFYDNVHLLTEHQEAWSDSLKYRKLLNDVEMFGHVELLDTTRDVAAVAGYMYYVDSTSYIRMTRDPAVIAVSAQDEKKDTVYMGADTLIYWTVRKCDLEKSVVTDSENRLKEVDADAISAYRRKAAEQARSAAEEAKKKLAEDDPNAAGSKDKGTKGSKGPAESGKSSSRAGSGAPAGRSSSSSLGGGKSMEGRLSPHLPGPADDCPPMVFPEYSKVRQVPDTLVTSPAATRKDPPSAKKDSLEVSTDSLKVNPDSLKQKDSLANVHPDTTKIGFLLGLRNVKVFRRDMQVACDSLVYNDLDSLIRLFKQPVVWNEIKRQYSADSITVIVHNRTVDRASLMSNAFIIAQEDSLCYDQIKGAEMMAYFDSTGALKRFDSMGGASGLFYIEENGVLATVNKFEAKMLTASFSNGNIDNLNYFQEVKSDAYPVVQLKNEDKLLKGYDWQPDKRPEGPSDITSLTPRESERSKYESVPRADFPQTDIYFPGYMESVYKILAHQDSIKRVRQAERKRMEELRKEKERHLADSLKVAASADSLKALSADSLAVRDSLSAKKDSLAVKDSLSAKKDALSTSRDTSSLKSSIADTLSNKGGSVSGVESKAVEKARRNIAKAKEKADSKARIEEKRALRDTLHSQKQRAKEAKWAEMDAKEAAKAKVKEEKALEKKRIQTLKTLKAVEKREAKEQKTLERYKARFERRKAREDARKASKSADASEKSDSKGNKKSGVDSKTPVTLPTVVNGLKN